MRVEGIGFGCGRQKSDGGLDGSSKTSEGVVRNGGGVERTEDRGDKKSDSYQQNQSGKNQVRNVKGKKSTQLLDSYASNVIKIVFCT